MTPTDAARVAEIAGTLTKAQREAFKSPRHYHISSITTASCRCALQRKGLVVDRMYCEQLTELGLAVREYLQSRSREQQG